jgi:putative membrane protein
MRDLTNLGSARRFPLFSSSGACRMPGARSARPCHTQTSNELKTLVSGGDVQATLPTAPDSASQKQIDKLNAATPADFRGEYDPMQVSAHKSAVSLFERYAKGGDNAKLKDWAQKTLPHLQHHLEMANMLDQRKK